MKKSFLISFVLAVFIGCAGSPGQPNEPQQTSVKPKFSSQKSRYDVKDDYSPSLLLDPDLIEDATPRVETIKKAGNKSPYTVLGKTYEVMSIDKAKRYQETGGASWYGLKFHGHLTSNGEIYNIYAMTAAHKTLPIPSYVKVTNLSNGRTAIVRVNDRGPFHKGRIIDLSYAAATKLDFIKQGTTQVKVEVLDSSRWLKEHKNQSPDRVMLQAAAYSDKAVAEARTKELQKKIDAPVWLEHGKDNFYRLKVGPLPSDKANMISDELQGLGFAKPLRLAL